MTTLSFPTLFMVTKLGKTKLWKVKVENDAFIRQDHFVDGKVKDPVTRKCKTTNSGKINERDPHEQACFEAARAWIRSLDKGYSPDEEDENGTVAYEYVMSMKTKGETNHNLPVLLVSHLRGEKKVIVKETSSGVRSITASKKIVKTNTVKKTIQIVIKPMLAEKLEKKTHLFDPIKDTWYIQPKLDGVRCVARKESEGGVVLTTRTGKQFVHLSHIYENVDKLLKRSSNSKIVLDGELYTDSLRIDEELVLGNDRFDKISGACRPIRSEPAPYEKQISYFIFDIVDTTGTIVQTERKKMLRELELLWKIISTQKTRNIIRFIPYQRVKDMGMVKECQTKWIAEGYEGVILRKGEGKYEQRRSASLLKYKEFDDEEYEIVGATEGKCTEKDCVMWKCTTEDGDVFDVRPQGTFEDRKILYENRNKYIGKMLTVKFQGKSDDGVPRFPVGVAIRDYE